MSTGLAILAVVLALQNTSWTTASHPEFRLAFDETSVNGNLICNRFKGGVESDGSHLRLDKLITTRRGCGPAESQAEMALKQKLERVREYRFEGSSMILLDASGREVLRLRPA